MSHDLSHSHSQLLRFQRNTLSHIPLLINYLHSHLHLSLFPLCSICLVSLVLDIKLNTLTFMFLMVSGTYYLPYGSLIVLQLPLHLFIVML